MSQHRTRLVTHVISLIVLVVFLAGFGRISTHADEASIKLRSVAVESKFGKSITFHTKADSLHGKIVSARVLVQPLLADYKQIHVAEAFTPADSTDLTAVWDTVADAIPPWQPMNYQWELTDDTGAVTLTDLTRFEYADDTHPWKSLKGNKVIVYWYDQPEGFGQVLLNIAQRAIDQYANVTGFTPDGEVRVVLYPNHDDYMGFYPTVTRSVNEWNGGQTYGSITVQWLYREDGGAYTLNEVIPHELAHAVLYFRANGQMDKVPAWLNEGQAMNNQFFGVTAAVSRMRNLASHNKVLRLSEMENYASGGSTAQEIRNWYDEATSLVDFLYTKYEPTALGKLVTCLNEGMKIDEAIKEATGLTQIEFENEWRNWIGASVLTDADIRPVSVLELPAFPANKRYNANVAIVPTSAP